MSSIYLRNGVWQIQYVDNGKTVQRSLKTADPAEAEEARKEIDRRLAEAAALRVIHRGVGTVGELAAAYVRHAEVFH
jgi:hypothetical protein